MIRTLRQMAAEAGQPYDPPAAPRRGTLPLVDRILSRLPIGCTRVLASEQYGMQFILTANNEIVFRDDELPSESSSPMHSTVAPTFPPGLYRPSKQ